MMDEPDKTVARILARLGRSAGDVDKFDDETKQDILALEKGGQLVDNARDRLNVI